MAEHFNLNFMHPQYGTTLNVDIDPDFSVQEILEQLVLSGFVGKANAAYDLELMGQALEKQTVFADIPNLYDGAVLKVVERVAAVPTTTIAAASTQPVVQSIALHCQHPDNSLQFSASYAPSTSLKHVLARTIQQGFLIGEVEQFHLYKGAQALDLEQDVQELGLQEGDHLQIYRKVVEEEKEETPQELGPVVTLQSLQEQVQQLEGKLAGQLEQLKQQLPRDQALPDVGELPYESLEKVVRRLRKRGKESSLSSLSLAGTPIWLYVLLALLLLGGIIVVLGMTLSGLL